MGSLMKNTYQAPLLQEIGGVVDLTAAFGTDPRTDFSEFPLVPADTGSFDVCDSNPNNNPDGSFCDD